MENDKHLTYHCLLAFFPFFFFLNKLAKHRTDKPQNLSNRYTWHLGGLKATKPHLRLLQKLPGKQGFTGEQAHTLKGTGQPQRAHTNCPITRFLSHSLLHRQNRAVLFLRKNKSCMYMCVRVCVCF